MRRVLAAIAMLSCAAPAQAQQPEAMSLLGKPLIPPLLSGDERKAADAELERARTAYNADPRSADAMLALARATARTGRLTEALELYTRGLESHPEDARMLLERGRYYVVIRKFDVALKDFKKAAETKPDARCDAGIASYLKGDFAAARDALQTCTDQPWPYVAALRAGSVKAAAPPATGAMVSAYISAVQQLAAGHTDQARDGLKTIVQKNGAAWMDPIYIAAEADLARLPKRSRRK